MLDEESEYNGTGRPNVLCTVLPSGSNIAAIPVKAIAPTHFPLPRTRCDSVLYVKVLPDPPGPSM